MGESTTNLILECVVCWKKKWFVMTRSMGWRWLNRMRKQFEWGVVRRGELT